MAIHCPECRFEFPQGLHPLPSQCPRCGAPLYFAQELPPPAPKRKPNYGYLRHSPTVVIIALCVIGYLIEILVGRSFSPSVPALLKTGASDGGLIFTGQWWRLFTAMFLHGSLLHIASNMWALFNLGLLAEILYGRRNYIFLYLIAGLGGSVLSVLWHPQVVGVGASGAIFGIAGALLPALKFQKNPRISMALKGALKSIFLFVVLNLVLGATLPVIDNAAHIGGLLTGLVVGFLLPSYTVEEERRRTGQALTVFVAAFAILLAGALYAKKKYVPNPLLTKAQVLIQQGKPNEAVALYQKELKNDPDDETLLMQYVSILSQLKRQPEELAVLDKLAKDHPENPDYPEAICIAHLGAKELDQAQPACERAAELNPKNPGVLFNLGSIYMQTQQNGAAVATFRKAYDLNPKRFNENFFLGMALLQDGQKLEAAQKLKKAVELNPRDIVAQKALAEAESK
jgi:rhomboid protease GluP